MTKQRNRRPTRAGHTSATPAATPTAEAPPAAETPRSDPHELDFLPVREGREWGAGDVDTYVRKSRETFEDAEADAGLRVWRCGDHLFELYNGFPERAKGHATFVEFATHAFDLTEDDVREYLRIRKGLRSADEARQVGRRKLSLGLRLLALVGLETFAALKNQDLPQPDGTTCRFPATVAKLQAAIALLGKKQPQPESSISRRVKSELVLRRGKLDEARAQDPELASARVQYAIHEREVVLEARHLTQAQSLALARFLIAQES